MHQTTLNINKQNIFKNTFKPIPVEYHISTKFSCTLPVHILSIDNGSFEMKLSQDIRRYVTTAKIAHSTLNRCADIGIFDVQCKSSVFNGTVKYIDHDTIILSKLRLLYCV